jgi:cell division protein ZapA
MTDRPSRQRYSVTVSIVGERHVLRSDAEPEYTVRVAQHVDSTMRALGSAQPLEPHRTAILAALSITDELFRTREELARLRAEMDSRAALLATRVSAVVAGANPQPARSPSRTRKKGV